MVLLLPNPWVARGPKSGTPHPSTEAAPQALLAVSEPNLAVLSKSSCPARLTSAPQKLRRRRCFFGPELSGPEPARFSGRRPADLDGASGIASRWGLGESRNNNISAH